MDKNTWQDLANLNQSYHEFRQTNFLRHNFSFFQNVFAQNTNQIVFDSINAQFKICKDDARKVSLYGTVASTGKEYNNFIDNTGRAYGLPVGLNQIDALKRKGINLVVRINYMHGIAMGVNSPGQYLRQRGNLIIWNSGKIQVKNMSKIDEYFVKRK